jgi:hypothetical protein
MSNAKVSREQILNWFSNFPWHEHHRCCDQQYGFEEGRWSEEELEDLRLSLTDDAEDDGEPWEVPLYFGTDEVGSIRIDPKRLFASLQADLAREGGEVAAAATDRAVAIVAGILEEAWVEKDLVERLNNEVALFAPLLAEGPAGVPKALNELRSINDLRSRRLIRALYAIGNANTLQAGLRKDAHPARRQHIEETAPQRLVPTRISTAAVVRKLRSLMEVTDHDHGSFRPGGRPAKVDRTKVPALLQATRSELAPLHRQLRKLHSPPARRKAIADNQSLSERLAAADLAETLIHCPCPPLEELACMLLGRELELSQHTVRRYGRAAVSKTGRD